MSYVDERHIIDMCPNHGLCVYQCGWQRCYRNHSCGPKLYRHYSVTFVLKGRGYYSVNGQTYEITSGQGFVIYPNVSTYYIADADEPWEYIFAVFYGSDVDALLESVDVSFSNPVFEYPNDSSMQECLEAMCAASRSGNALGYDVIGHFYLSMSRIVKSVTAEQVPDDPQQAYIRKAIAYIKTNYTYGITISDIADYVGIERSYLYRIFQEKLNCSPKNYLQLYRLKCAVDLLRSDNLCMAEIACTVGFYDSSHFSKCFRKHYGVAPGDYISKSENNPNPKS